MTRRMLGPGSAVGVGEDPSATANAPSGMGRAEAVPTTHLVRPPAAEARLSSSRANRVLPTPGGPAITTPAEFPDSTRCSAANS